MLDRSHFTINIQMIKRQIKHKKRKRSCCFLEKKKRAYLNLGGSSGHKNLLQNSYGLQFVVVNLVVIRLRRIETDDQLYHLTLRRREYTQSITKFRQEKTKKNKPFSPQI